MTFPNVLVTGHQAFLTKEALEQISIITLGNISAFENGEQLINEVKPA
jgi:D-lactate dehydrogenase